jgi:hypothetical protein
VVGGPVHVFVLPSVEGAAPSRYSSVTRHFHHGTRIEHRREKLTMLRIASAQENAEVIDALVALDAPVPTFMPQAPKWKWGTVHRLPAHLSQQTAQSRPLVEPPT